MAFPAFALSSLFNSAKDFINKVNKPFFPIYFILIRSISFRSFMSLISFFKLRLSSFAFLIISVIFLTACGSQVSDLELRVAKLETEIASMRKGGGSTIVPAGAFPKFSFDQEEHNFGQIRDGDIVSHTFRFTNSGEAPLIISKATAACGCTVPQWPKQPIPVGGSGEIQVQFDSSNKPGMQNKVVTITANTESKVKKLLIRAQVNPRS